MRLFPSAMALVCGCSIMIAQAVYAENATTVSTSDIVIPAKGQGIFVSAICGKGCLATNIGCDVYVVDETEYKKCAGSFDKLTSKGKTPLVLRDLPPGTYHVGVVVKLDACSLKDHPGAVPVKQDVRGMNPDCDGFFANDLPEMHVVSGRVVPAPDTGYMMAWWWCKWQRVTVTKDNIQPVVAIFVPKNESLDEWSRNYPTKNHFRNQTPKEANEVFWREIEKMSAQQDVKIDRAGLINLVEKGGRVCVPKTPCVVSIGGDGWLKVEVATIGGANTHTTPDRVGSMAPVRPVLVSPASTARQENKETSAGLPPFQKELIGGDEVRVLNPNSFAVKVGLRSGEAGKDFSVEPGASKSVQVPDGSYDVFFIYSSEPSSLYRGDSFTLRGNGVEIQIVQVVDGNYAIRKVKGNP